VHRLCFWSVNERAWNTAQHIQTDQGVIIVVEPLHGTRLGFKSCSACGCATTTKSVISIFAYSGCYGWLELLLCVLRLHSPRSQYPSLLLWSRCLCGVILCQIFKDSQPRSIHYFVHCWLTVQKCPIEFASFCCTLWLQWLCALPCETPCNIYAQVSSLMSLLL